MFRGSTWVWGLLVGAFCVGSLHSQKAVEDFTFNPLSVQRDPFSPPEVKKGDLSVNELTRFDLFEMKVVAIMTGLGASKAMLVLPNGNTHIVQKGDKIGKNSGYIVDIKANELVVLESFKDFRGRVKKSYESMTLAK
jgi:Tfp pilus assembly protein PilP